MTGKRSWSPVLGLAVIVAGLIALGHQHVCDVQAARRGWSTPAKISMGPAGSEATWPSIAAVSNVTVTSVWADDRMGSDDDLYCTLSDDSGRSWPVEDSAVCTSTLPCATPKIARGGDGRVHAVWATGHSVMYSVNATGTWLSPTVVVEYEDHSVVDPAVAVDSGNVIHVVWSDDSPPPEIHADWRIFYSQSSDGINWTSPYSLSGANIELSWAPAITIDGDDTIHVVWWDVHSPVYEIRYTAGDGSDNGWIKPPTILGDVIMPNIYCYPDVTTDVGGGVHVVWCDLPYGSNSQQVRYRERPSGEGWEAAEAIPGSRMRVFSTEPTYILPRIVTGAGGGPYVVWHGITGSDDPDENLHFAEKSGDSWIPASPVRMSPYVRDLNPDLDVDSEGVVHLVWQQERSGEDAYDIYHSYSLNERVTLPLVMRKYS
jgi:hypothetical protein